MEIEEGDDHSENAALWNKTDTENEEQSKGNTSRPTSGWYVLPASVTVAAFGGILFGYDVGIISGAILLLREEFKLTCIQQELVVTVLIIGGLVSSFVGGSLLDQFGRKRIIILNAFIFLIGACVLAFANSFPIFIVGRFILGFAVALSAVSDCVYISEIAPPRRRGLLVSLNELGITLGLLLAYLVNYILIDVDNGWRYMFGISAIPALGQAIGMFFLPYSPRWLLSKGFEEQSERIVGTLWPNVNPKVEIARLKTSLSREQNYRFLDLFSNKDNMRMRMFIGCGVILFQQLTGQPTVLYYAPVLFKRLGFNANTSATLATIGLGAVKVVFTLGTLLSVDKLGRRRFLLLGAVTMTLSLIILSAVTEPLHNSTSRPACHEFVGTEKVHSHLLAREQFLYNCTQPFNTSISSKNRTTSDHLISNLTNLANTTNKRSIHQISKHCTNSTLVDQNNFNDVIMNSAPIPKYVKYTCLTALMLFVIGYAIGYGPLSWLLLTEIFPTAIKGRAASVATSVNWGTNIIISLTFLDVLGSLGPFVTFLIYSLFGSIAVIFILHFVPETKNRSLEEISSILNERKLKCGKQRCCDNGKILIDDERDVLLNEDEAEDVM